MINTSYTIHKSMLLVVREALALYLFKKDREEDITKVKTKLINLDEYKGDRVPISVVIKEVETISNMFYDESLGVNLLLLADLKSLPFYKLIRQCIEPINYHQSKLSFLIFIRIISNFFSLLTQSVELKVTETRNAVYIKIEHHESKIISRNQMDGLIVIIYRIIDTFYPKAINNLYLKTYDINSSLYRYVSLLNISVSSSDVNALAYHLEDELYYEKLNNEYYIFGDVANINFLVAPLLNDLEQQFGVISYRQNPTLNLFF